MTQDLFAPSKPLEAPPLNGVLVSSEAQTAAARKPDPFMQWYNAPEGTPVPADLTEDEAMTWAGNFRFRYSKMQWKIVEFIMACEGKWNEQYVQIAECTGLSPERIGVMISVGKATILLRQKLLKEDDAYGEVPFSYFEAVASSHIPDHKKQELIECAFHYGLSRDNFREYVKKQCPSPRDTTPRLPTGEKEKADKKKDEEENAITVVLPKPKQAAVVQAAHVVGAESISQMLDGIAEGTIEVFQRPTPAAIHDARERFVEALASDCDGVYAPDEQAEAPAPSEEAVTARVAGPAVWDELLPMSQWHMRLSPAARECLPDLQAYFRTDDLVDVVSQAVLGFWTIRKSRMKRYKERNPDG